MNTSARLEDFQFIRGDPRPYFYQYATSQFQNLKGMVDIKPKQQKFLQKDVFVFKCNPETSKRMLVPPQAKVYERFQSLMSNSNVKIIIIPVLMIRKLNCKQKGNSRHHNLILYNKVTHEVERLDVRKYHLDGFSLKLWIKKLQTDIVEKLGDDKANLLLDLDVPLKIINKLGCEKSRDVYPQFLLAYLKARNDFPDLDRQRILSKVGLMAKANIDKLWEGYVQYRQSIVDKCKEGMMVNSETNKCLRPLSKSFQKYLVEKPRAACSDNKQYNHLLEKCVPPSKMVDVNVMLEQVLSTEAQKGKKVNLIHMDRHVPIILGAMNFILRKYPYAKFIRPDEDDTREIKKRMFQMIWRYNDVTKKFSFKVADEVWNSWSKAMVNPAIQFVICFLHLDSKDGGKHANVLIYDKSTNEMERFDGLGRDLAKSYHWQEMDEEIQKAFASKPDIFPKPIKYYQPIDFCPKMPVFQSKEIDEVPGEDLTGNCAVWRMWYIDVRMANPHLKRTQLVKFAAKKVVNTGSLYKFIKGYQKYILSALKAENPKMLRGLKE